MSTRRWTWRASQALPKSLVVSDSLGWIYYKRQLYDSAVPLLQEAVRNEPKNGEYRFHLEASLRKREDVQKVIGQLSKT